MSIPRLLECSIALLLLLHGAASATADDDAAQRERIARERSVVERESKAAQAACAAQFEVTACVDRAKAARSQRLLVLDRERAVLDDELHKHRAAQRIERLRQRQAQASQGPPDVAVRTRAPAVSEAAARQTPKTENPLKAPRAPHDAASAVDSGAALRAAHAARRASEAAAHRVIVEKRNEARAKQRKPAAPLQATPAMPAAPAASQP